MVDLVTFDLLTTRCNHILSLRESMEDLKAYMVFPWVFVLELNLLILLNAGLDCIANFHRIWIWATAR